MCLQKIYLGNYFLTNATNAKGKNILINQIKGAEKLTSPLLSLPPYHSGIVNALLIEPTLKVVYPVGSIGQLVTCPHSLYHLQS